MNHRLRRVWEIVRRPITASRVQAFGILVLGLSAITATTVAATDEEEEDTRQDHFLERISQLEAELAESQLETDCRARLAADLDVVRADVTGGLSDGLILLVTNGAESPEMGLQILYLQELNRQLREATQRREDAAQTCNQEE